MSYLLHFFHIKEDRYLKGRNEVKSEADKEKKTRNNKILIMVNKPRVRPTNRRYEMLFINTNSLREKRMC